MGYFPIYGEGLGEREGPLGVLFPFSNLIIPIKSHRLKPGGENGLGKGPTRVRRERSLRGPLFPFSNRIIPILAIVCNPKIVVGKRGGFPLFEPSSIHQNGRCTGGIGNFFKFSFLL